MAPITAKVRCNSRVKVHEQLELVTFSPDYLDADAQQKNAAWAYATPALSLQMNVRPEVAFEPGRSYTLTFEPDGDVPADSGGAG